MSSCQTVPFAPSWSSPSLLPSSLTFCVLSRYRTFRNNIPLGSSANPGRWIRWIFEPWCCVRIYRINLAQICLVFRHSWKKTYALEIVNRDDFRDYADFCFKEFGDRVKNWITLNEPNLFSMSGYALGDWAPGRCSNYIGNCSEGNSATEPYLVAHHLILSHATAANLYRHKYQVSDESVPYKLSKGGNHDCHFFAGLSNGKNWVSSKCHLVQT